MKSLETKFAEAMDAIKKAKCTKQYEEASKTFTTTTTIETKLNAAEAVLADAGVVREAQPIKKNNGRVENFVEGSPFNEGREFSPGYVQGNTAAHLTEKSNKALADGLLKIGKITEAEYAKMTGAKPEGYDKLTDQQRKDFDFARLIGISEADAFKVAKLSGGNFREVSRR